MEFIEKVNIPMIIMKCFKNLTDEIVGEEFDEILGYKNMKYSPQHQIK